MGKLAVFVSVLLAALLHRYAIYAVVLITVRTDGGVRRRTEAYGGVRRRMEAYGGVWKRMEAELWRPMEADGFLHKRNDRHFYQA